MRLCYFSNYFTKSSSSFFLNLGKLDKDVNVNRDRIPDLWTLVKDCECFQICSAMKYAIVIGSSGAIAMSLTVRKKQVAKQWRQQVV